MYKIKTRFMPTWGAMALLVLGALGCATTSIQDASTERTPAPGIQHYGSWGSYHIPFRPQEPISETEAKGRKAYYVAEYDQAVQLVRFQKVLDGTVEWTDHYTYGPQGKIQSRKMTKADGSITEQTFDEDGRIQR